MQRSGDRRDIDGRTYDVDAAWRDGSWVWDAVYENTPWGAYYTQNALRHLRRAVTSRPVHTVLDVGAGTGRFAIPLHSWGYAVTALDLDSRALQALSAKQPAIQVVHGAVGEVDLGRFDMVMSVGTVKYLSSFERFLAMSRESLGPEGVLFCEMLNPANLRQAARHALAAVRSIELSGPRFPTQVVPAHCRRALSAAGFQPLWMRGACLLVPGHASKNTGLFRLTGFLERALGLELLPSLSAQYFFTAIRA